MKNLTRDCQECNGWGTVTIEHNGTEIPYLQDVVDYECMSCTGTGQQLDLDLIKERIDEVEYMIDGMQTRMRPYSFWIGLFCFLFGMFRVLRLKSGCLMRWR